MASPARGREAHARLAAETLAVRSAMLLGHRESYAPRARLVHNALEGAILPNLGFLFKPIQSKDNFYLHAEGMYIHGSAADIFKRSVGIKYFLKPKEK